MILGWFLNRVVLFALRLEAGVCCPLAIGAALSGFVWSIFPVPADFELGAYGKLFLEFRKETRDLCFCLV
jgi:hypothetical protein